MTAVDTDVLDWVAELGAQYGLRTPDALQAASLLTNDEQGRFVPGDRDFAEIPGLSVHEVRPAPP